MLWMGLEATTFRRHSSKLVLVFSQVVSMPASLSKSCGFRSHSQHTVTQLNRVLLLDSCRQKNQVTIHKIIQYQPSQFQANVSFPYLLKKPRFLCSHGVQNWNIDLKWVNANKQFTFLSVVLQFLILHVGFELFILLSFI